MADGAVYSVLTELKNKYSKKEPIDAYQRKPFMWKRIGRGDETVEGNGLYWFLRTRPPGSLGAFNEDEALPRPQTGRGASPILGVKQYYGSLQISNKAKKMASSNPASFVKKQMDDMQELRKMMEKRFEVDLWRDGRAVHTGIVGAGATSATQSVQASWSMMEGQLYDIYDSTLVTRRNAAAPLQLLSKDVTANTTGGTVTFDVSVTTSSGDLVVPHNERVSAPSDGKAITGLQAIVDTTLLASSYLQLSRSANALWRGNIYNAGVPISLDLLQQLDDRLGLICGEECDEVWSHPAQRRTYLNLLTPQKRFTNLDLDGGFNVLEWNGKAWVTAADCDTDEIFLAAPETLEIYYTPDGELAWNEDGGSIWKVRDGYAMTYAYMEAYLNVACRQPNRWMKIYNLTTPAI